MTKNSTPTQNPPPRNPQMEALRDKLSIASYILVLLSLLNFLVLDTSQFSAFTAGAFAGSAVALVVFKCSILLTLS